MDNRLYMDMILIHEADPSRPHFSKQNKFQAKTMFATGETVGHAEWIIDDILSCFGYFMK